MFSPITTMCWHLYICSAKKLTAFNWSLTACADSCHFCKWVIRIHAHYPLARLDHMNSMIAATQIRSSPLHSSILGLSMPCRSCIHHLHQYRCSSEATINTCDQHSLQALSGYNGRTTEGLCNLRLESIHEKINSGDTPDRQWGHSR